MKKLHYFQAMAIFGFFGLSELVHAHHGGPHLEENLVLYAALSVLSLLSIILVSIALSNKKTDKIEVKK